MSESQLSLKILDFCEKNTSNNTEYIQNIKTKLLLKTTKHKEIV